MLDVNRPTALIAGTVENATIALLEAATTGAIATILLETCLARSEGPRGAVLIGHEDSMALAAIRPYGDVHAPEGSRIADRSSLVAGARRLLPPAREIATDSMNQIGSY
jgi:hypothetical protein